MSLFGVFVQDSEEPVELVGIFKTKEEAEIKSDQQYEWDVENGYDYHDVNMYFVLEVPYGTSSFERTQKNHIVLEELRTSTFNIHSLESESDEDLSEAEFKLENNYYHYQH